MKNFFAALFLVCMIIGCQNRSSEAFSLVRYIPKNTPVIVKVNNLSVLKSELINNDFIKETSSASFYNDLTGVLKSTGYLNIKDEALFCFNEIGKENFEYALITRYRKDLLPPDSLATKKIDTLLYDGTEIKKITTGNDTFFVTVTDRVFIASSSQLLTENIVRQRNAGDAVVDETFNKLYNTSDTQKSAVVFINNNEIKLLADSFFNDNIAMHTRDFADWTTAELSVTPDAIACTGIAMGASSLKTLNLFDKTVPQQNLTPAITPLNARGFVSFTFDDYKQFKANLTAYNNNRGRRSETKNDTLFSWVNEISLIFEKDNKNIVVRTSDTESAKDWLADGSETVSEFRGVPVYRYNNPQLFTASFSALITDMPVNFYALTDDFIVFSDTMAAIQNMITNYQNKATLAYSESFKNFIAGLNNEASVLMVGLQPGFKTALQETVSESYKKDIEAVNLKNYPYFAFQAINDRGFAHIAALIKKPAVANKSNAIVQLLSIILDADVAAPPQFVINHRTKQKEIIVQDAQNTIYLISHTGKVRWKKKLDGKIQGRIQQVDLYKNGRLQLAFVTQRKLHIIDRNGDEVAPFPISFTAAITQPLAVFDYEKNRDYRFLVCQRNKLSMYDSRGKTVSGFTLAQTQSDILSTPKHFRIRTKDYIVIPEENGKLNILHRTGKTRINVNRKIDFSDNEIYLYNDKFTTTNKAGQRIQIDERGGIAVINLNLEQNHHINTTSGTLVSLSDNILTIKGKKLTLDFGLYTPPEIFLVNNKIYIAVTDTQTNKVYMYDSNAALLPGFPVYGMAAIDLADVDNDNKPELTVQGDKNAILLYKMN